MGEGEFDVDRWCLLSAEPCVWVWCDMMLLKEMFPPMVLGGSAMEVEDACEVEKAMRKDEMMFVKCWAVVNDMGEECCGLFDMLE